MPPDELFREIAADLAQANRQGRTPVGLPAAAWPPTPLGACPACGAVAWVRLAHYSGGGWEPAGWGCWGRIGAVPARGCQR